MNTYPTLIATALLLTIGSVPSLAEASASAGAETSMPREKRLAWWREARFGLFIHWGPVSLTGKEISWSRANSNPKCPNHGPTPIEVYDNLYTKFNPTNFNAREWVKLARAAGTKYVVLTAKHCDGFLLWHSQTDDYSIARTPFRRDVCGELARAAHRQGMRLGWYFSPMDWRDPDFRTERNGLFLSRMRGELEELLTGYGRIDLLWFDWDSGEPLYDQPNTYALVQKLQPGIIINNRLDLGVGNNDNQILSLIADYYTPEQRIGHYDDQRPWETCMTLGTQWAWKPEDTIKSAQEVMGILARTAGGDGNLLLNVGPMPDGRIEPRQVQVLQQVGHWLKRYGESIYGTRGGPFKPTPSLTSTRRGNVIYIHVLKPEEGSLTLPGLGMQIVRGRVLTGGKLRIGSGDNSNVVLHYSRPEPASLGTVIKLVLNGSAEQIPSLDVPRSGLIQEKTSATASHVFQNDAQYAAGRAVDGDKDTRWATDAGTKAAWLQVDLGQPMTFDRMEVAEAYAGRIQAFVLQYQSGTEWRTCYQGTHMGDGLTARFNAVTAQQVRLNILDATDGPTITEFQLFAPSRKPDATR